MSKKVTSFTSEHLTRITNATNIIVILLAMPHVHMHVSYAIIIILCCMLTPDLIIGKGRQFISIYASVQCRCMHGTSHGSKLVYYNGNSHVFMGSVL